MSTASIREQRGAYLIEARATELEYGARWQPWLRLALARRADGVFASRTFDRLMPVFATPEAALRYASELGRCLVKEDSPLCPAWSGSSADGPSDGLNYGAAAGDADWSAARPKRCASATVHRSHCGR